MPRGRPIPDDVRAAAVEIVREHGLAEAVRRTGQAKNSLRSWAQKAGIDLTGRTSERNRQAAEASAARRRALVAEAERTSRHNSLTVVRDLALQQTVARIRTESMDDRSLIGAWTRATHDLALLSGQATERLASEPVNVDIQVTVRHELAARLDAMSVRMRPEAIEAGPVGAYDESAPGGSNGSTNGQGAPDVGRSFDVPDAPTGRCSRTGKAAARSARRVSCASRGPRRRRSDDRYTPRTVRRLCCHRGADHDPALGHVHVPLLGL